MTMENPPGHELTDPAQPPERDIPVSESRMRSRKFIITLIFMAAFIVGFFLDKISQEVFLGFVATVLGMYGGANLLAKHLEKKP